ncbi:MAG TPA: threonine/serine exporter family protein [Spirochaetales bacterium]|nr:threonine/serine exporter family protein [Spirochaetales bacterium]
MNEGYRSPDPEEVLVLAADAARIVLESGGETYRAEDTSAAICSSLGGAEAECFATPTCVVLSCSAADGRSRSIVRRVRKRSMNLERVARVNSLVRSLAAGRVDFDGAAMELGEIESLAGRSALVSVPAAALGTGAFALLFGGGWREGLVAAAVGALVSRFVPRLARRALPDFFINLVGGAAATALCLAARALGLAGSAEAAAIGVVMLLVPGVAITNAIRDTIAGDLVAGVARGADAFMAAAAISIGAGGAYLLMPAGAVGDMAGPSSLGPLWAGLGTVGFAILFELRKGDLPLAALGGAIGWAAFELISLPSGSSGLGYFAAAAAIGLWSEALAAARRKPATVYMICGIIPLVPGGGMYYTMLEYVRGNTWASVSTGFAALQAAGAIAAGLAVSSATSRLLSLRALARRALGSRGPR